jgi:hypothetical protein
MTSATAIKRQSTTTAPTVPGLTTEGSGISVIGNNLPMGEARGRIRTLLLTLIFLTFTAIVSVAGFRFANPELRTDLVAFTIDSKNQTTIRFLVVRKDSQIALTCRIIARDFSTAIVGDRYVDVAPSNQKSVEVTERIPTRSKAVNADLVRCLPKDR